MHFLCTEHKSVCYLSKVYFVIDMYEQVLKYGMDKTKHKRLGLDQKLTPPPHPLNPHDDSI
jgi:hypothetical protein